MSKLFSILAVVAIILSIAFWPATTATAQAGEQPPEWARYVVYKLNSHNERAIYSTSRPRFRSGGWLQLREPGETFWVQLDRAGWRWVIRELDG